MGAGTGAGVSGTAGILARAPGPGAAAVGRCSIGRVKAILFDWDGTLVDSLDGLYTANAAVMATFGLPFDETLYRRHFSPDWRLMYERLGVPRVRLDEASARWLEAYAGGSQAALLPGARDALARLAAAGYRLGLVTAGHREIVEPQLSRFDVGRYFEVAVFGTDLEEQKPHPRPLRHALDLLASPAAGPVEPRDAAYLGDTAEDMAMAVTVGVRAVGVPSRVGAREGLEAAGASEIVESVAAWADGLLGDGPAR